MSNNWFQDMKEMHTKYGVGDWVTTHQYDNELLKKYLEFRMDFIDEERKETLKAIADGDAEEVVDGLIDLCVVAIGTLEAFGVDANKAWNEVLRANLSKQVGVKESRPNELGLPDLIKPDGWQAPSHKGNHGKLNKEMLLCTSKVF